jgi:hypothetical protein
MSAQMCVKKVSNMPLRPRNEINAIAAIELSKYIKTTGVSIRGFATKVARMPESTLRHFLGNGGNSRQHKRGPYTVTLKPLLELTFIPHELREAILDAVFYEDRFASGTVKAAETSERRPPRAPSAA